VFREKCKKQTVNVHRKTFLNIFNQFRLRPLISSGIPISTKYASEIIPKIFRHNIFFQDNLFSKEKTGGNECLRKASTERA